MALQPVRGTRDLLPEESLRYRHLTATARRIAALYGFGEIATPVFEFTDVFKRNLGDTTDVVTKEMYTFDDRGGESLTLRPEGTAAIVRAFISQGLAQQVPLRFYYEGPMFRYERPQKGRYRQFHQIGVEFFGAAEPQADIEVIALAVQLLAELGLGDKTVLELNSMGDAESRAAYRDGLVTYFRDHALNLSDDSRIRLDKNPLRILDSKNENDRRIVAGAPSIAASFNALSADYFAAVKEGLDGLGIAYTLSPTLVRGFDYYCHSVFEFTTAHLGAQGAVIGGGRYDGLVEMMGGPATPATGWAGGIERLAMLMQADPKPPRPVALVPIGETAERAALKMAQDLRQAGFAVDLGYKGNVGRRMKRANKVNACAAIILGDDELQAGAAKIKDLDSGTETTAALNALPAALAGYAVARP